MHMRYSDGEGTHGPARRLGEWKKRKADPHMSNCRKAPLCTETSDGTQQPTSVSGKTTATCTITSRRTSNGATGTSKV